MSKLPGFPDFFIVGCPRCGTTALSRYLKKHPKICFAKPKEPHYFTWVAPTLGEQDLRAHYLDRYFPHYQSDVHLSVGEGSVSYLYSPDVIREILDLNPDARFIVSVRDPFQMLPSYHARLLYTLEEDEPDFARAWELQDGRLRGEHVPRHCRDPHAVQYRDVAKFGSHLEHLYDLAGRERVLVSVFDDFRADPRAAYERILAFLGVPSDGRTDFPPKQVSKFYRHYGLHRWLYRPPKSAAIVLQAAEKTRSYSPDRKKPLVTRMRKRITNWNTIERKPEPLSPAMEETVRKELAPEIDLLAKLIDRDLGEWMGKRRP